jgi:tRNA threonylcarbamoyl adenosine modification protein (Sua5/YciO/YrdC/YwlC family)
LSVGEADIAAAVVALAAGELIVFPTETLYGVGCDALNDDALARLRAVKQRGADKGVAVIAGDAAMLRLLSDQVCERALRLAAAFWPGPLTLLLPARSDLPAAIVLDGRVGVRVSAHPVAREMSRRLGRPIAAPSANPAGLEPARDVAAARAYFGPSVACYIDDGPIAGAPSTLIDPGPPLRVVREGAIPRSALEEVLRRDRR